jgi:formylglycine-generating enzyme required for sulfatase activity
MHCGGAVVAPDGMSLMDKGCPQALRAGLVGIATQDITPEGIHDLAGNLGEWTATAYVDDNRMAATDGKGDIRRVIRGGSWAAETSYLARSSGRTFRLASGAGTNVGFRCASSPILSSN